MRSKFTKIFTLDADKYYSCDRKIQYPAEDLAKDGVKLMKKKGIRGLEAYRCRFSGSGFGTVVHWHIGHPK